MAVSNDTIANPYDIQSSHDTCIYKWQMTAYVFDNNKRNTSWPVAECLEVGAANSIMNLSIILARSISGADAADGISSTIW